MRNGLVFALLLLAQAAAASPRDTPGERISARIVCFDLATLKLPTRPGPVPAHSRSSVALAGDPDSPVDSARPLALFANGPGRLRLDLPSRSHVSVEVVAVNGRRVGGRDLGFLDAGSHVLADLGLGRASAGVYFARVRAGTGFAQGKFIKLR